MWHHNREWPEMFSHRLLRNAIVLAGFVAGGHAHAQSHIVTTAKLDWSTAGQLAAEAVRACAAQGYSVTATVVDTTGHQQAVIKGDSVPLQSLSVSYRKAYTAYSYGLAFNMDTTSELIAAKVTGPANGALNTIPEVLFVPGGVTLRRVSDHAVLGGIGVSGAPGGEKDEACAQAAVTKFRADFR
ncbi:heme-binding protein [Komagataeibacter kakiaceti JCM 25156]